MQLKYKFVMVFSVEQSNGVIVFNDLGGSFESANNLVDRVNTFADAQADNYVVRGVLNVNNSSSIWESNFNQSLIPKCSYKVNFSWFHD